MARHARFIVFEGLDGAGTTTQAAKLQALFTRRGTPSFLTNEPTPDPVGVFIRRLLTGNERAGDGTPYVPGERVMGLLFAADRMAHSAVIEARRRAGEIVVCDRYIFSPMAYQTLDTTIYENRAHLETIARNYERLLPQYEANFGEVIRVDGTMGVDDVHAAVVAAIGIE
jgi:thymidylate kinase